MYLASLCKSSAETAASVSMQVESCMEDET